MPIQASIKLYGLSTINSYKNNGRIKKNKARHPSYVAWSRLRPASIVY